MLTCLHLALKRILLFIPFQSFALSVPYENYSRNAPCALNVIRFCYNHLVNTSAGGLLDPDGIISPVCRY